MRTLNEIVGEQIRKRRKAVGMSQGELAQRLCLSHQTSVSFWETAKCCPNAIYLCALADVLECTVDELLGRNV